MHVDDPLQPLLPADLRVALAGEHPADGPRPAQPPRHADQFRLAVDGALAAVGIGVGEIGRAAEHRHGEAGRGDRLAHPVEISVGSRLVKKPSYISRPSASSDRAMSIQSKTDMVRSPAIWSM